jgi:hypothetical protein
VDRSVRRRTHASFKVYSTSDSGKAKLDQAIEDFLMPIAGLKVALLPSASGPASQARPTLTVLLQIPVTPPPNRTRDKGVRMTDTIDREVTSFSDLGRDMWDYLTGKDAAINYEFIDMLVEVPKDTGDAAPRATWKLNGTLRITTSDNARRR